MSEPPVIREATSDGLAQIVPLFLASVDTSLPGRKVPAEPTYAPAAVHARLHTRLFPPRSLRTLLLELPSSGTIVAYDNVSAPSDSESDSLRQGRVNEVDMVFVRTDRGRRGYGMHARVSGGVGWPRGPAIARLQEE